MRDLRGAQHIRHRPGEPPDSFLDLSGRERAKRQAEETLAATFGEEGESVGEIEGALRGCFADGGMRRITAGAADASAQSHDTAVTDACARRR